MQPLKTEDPLREIAEAVEALPEKERLVLCLHHYEKLNPKEIGAILGASEASVRQIRARALLRLPERVLILLEN